MSVKQTNRTAHNEPIYFVALEATPAGQVLITSTQSATQTGPDGYPVTYEQRINGATGACCCGCKGFQESIAVRATKDGATPTVSNGRTCKHIRKAAQSGREWGYLAARMDIEPVLAEIDAQLVEKWLSEPVQLAKVEAPAAFDWVAHFER
jgi:hypothetical protein